MTIETDASEPGRTASTRSAQAYEDLRALLLEGGYEPNTRLTEAELTKRLGVSRGTLRSAFVRLGQEGYITNEPNRGARTRSFSVDEAIEILETREVLESALAAKAAEQATEDELRALGDTLEQMREAEESGERDRYSRLNRQFHRQVHGAAHQQTLVALLDSLVYPLVMRQYRDVQAAHPRTSSLNEHRAVYDAILTRNSVAAAACMRHHVSAALRALVLTREAASAGSR